jgi:hypothetical protein
MDLMLSRFFGNERLVPAEMRKLLAQGRRHLWRRELPEAEELFLRVRDEIQSQNTNNRTETNQYKELHWQASWGLWGVAYLRNPDTRLAVQKLIDNNRLNTEAVFFIAKLFQLQEDISPQAISVYQRLLYTNSSRRLAERIATLIADVALTKEIVDLLELIIKRLPADSQRMVRLCKWYFQTGSLDNAHRMASQILRHEADNIDAQTGS